VKVDDGLPTLNGECKHSSRSPRCVLARRMQTSALCSVNPGWKCRATYASGHYSRPGDPVQKLATVKLDLSARRPHVNQGQFNDQLELRDSAVVATWHSIKVRGMYRSKTNGVPDPSAGSHQDMTISLL